MASIIESWINGKFTYFCLTFFLGQDTFAAPELSVAQIGASAHLINPRALMIAILEKNTFPKTTFSENTLDGRNPAPVDRLCILLFTRFYTSEVVQDFFHQQCFRLKKKDADWWFQKI